jgi:uncharacterized protein YciI
MPHYLIMYRPPREDFAENATPEETAIIERHFEYLQKQEAEGRLILAGRPEDGRFGIALVEAKSENEAKQIMADDPAVKEGVFSGELLPFRLAILRGGE